LNRGKSDEGISDNYQLPLFHLSLETTHSETEEHGRSPLRLTRPSPISYSPSSSPSPLLFPFGMNPSSSSTSRTAAPSSLPMPSPPLPSSPNTQPFHPLVPSSTHPPPIDSPSNRSNYDLSPRYYRNAVEEVHSVLYGGGRRDREAIRRVVDEFYSGGAGPFGFPSRLSSNGAAVRGEG
jgi:hypothetical protein